MIDLMYSSTLLRFFYLLVSIIDERSANILYIVK
jgi:hypothetical protein